MPQRRTLSLKRETLTEIAATALAGVVGAQALPTLAANCFSAQIRCVTDNDRTTCLNCE
jgi:hypothetical protein